MARLWYNVSVSHTPNQAQLRTLSNVERGAQPRVQHYQCSQRGLVWGMGHWHYTTASQHCSLYHGLAIYTEVTFVNVTLVEAGSSGGGPAVVYSETLWHCAVYSGTLWHCIRRKLISSEGQVKRKKAQKVAASDKRPLFTGSYSRGGEELIRC